MLLGTTNAMWQHYRRTFGFIQIGIVVIAIALLFYFHAPWQSVAFDVVIMEVFSFIGALWAVRLRRKVQNARDENVTLR